MKQMRANVKELVRAAAQERAQVKRYQELNVRIGLVMKKINQNETQNESKTTRCEQVRAELEDKAAQLRRQEAEANAAKAEFTRRYNSCTTL